MMRPQCEAQVGVRPTLKWNCVTIPVAVWCPHFAEPGSKFCHRHQAVLDASRNWVQRAESSADVETVAASQDLPSPEVQHPDGVRPGHPQDDAWTA